VQDPDSIPSTEKKEKEKEKMRKEKNKYDGEPVLVASLP
jgi:hypothetical protein